MTTKQNVKKGSVPENDMSLMDFLFLLKKYWYYFLISVGICVGLALFYVKKAPRIYVRTATVLMKEDSKSGGMSEMAIFSERNLYNSNRGMDNEMILFKATRLMEEVVRHLHLDISYQMQFGLRMVELYKESPVFVSFPDAEESDSFSFQVIPLSAKQVQLTGFTGGGATEEEKEQFIKVALNDTVMTPVGKIVVSPTLYYLEKYLGTYVTVSKSNLKSVTQGFRGGLVVESVGSKSSIISLTFQDVSIPRAEDIINTLITVYNEDAMNDKKQIVINTSSFIDERLQIIEKELQTVDTDIEVYKKANRLTDISSEAGMYLSNSSTYNSEDLQLENQLRLAQYVKDYLEDPKKTTELIPVGISDVSIESQVGEYNRMLLKRNSLLRNSGGNNPVVMDLNSSLGAMKPTIIRSVDNLIAGLEIKMDNLRERSDLVSRHISAVPTQQKYVLSVERQQKIKEELYLYLLNKREENALTQAITESNVRIVDPALGDDAPIQPKSSMIVMAAFMIGVFIPGAVLWLIAVSDTKVHARKDVEEVLDIPFLGEVPLRDKKKEKDELVVRKHSRDSVSEAFRIIRTNIDFVKVKTKQVQVLMFTSLDSNAGKTFVSFNLAVSMALTHKRVVLLDVDIRKATLSHMFVPNAKFGITHYLSGKINSVEDIIYPSGIDDGLDIIACGPIPPNPAELLLSERLELLIAELRKHYEYIIIDNVPAMMVADAAIVSRVTDLTVYVIRAEYMDKRQLPELQKLYDEERFTNLSVILNGVRCDRKGYGYGYGYGYGLEKNK